MESTTDLRMGEDSEGDRGELFYLYMILTLQHEDDTADRVLTVNLTYNERKF